MTRIFPGRVAVALTLSFLASTTLAQTVVGPDETLSLTTSTAEDFLLEGGALRVNALTLSGEIALSADSIIIRSQNPLTQIRPGSFREASIGPTELDGPIVGPGGLSIVNLSIDEVLLNGENTYLGETSIVTGSVVATTAQSLGSTAAGTVVRGGALTVRFATDESFRIEAGTLRFDAGDFAPARSITIAGGALHLPHRENIATPVVVEGTGGVVGFDFRGNTSWTGGSTGTGSLQIEGPVSVDAPLLHDGDVIVAGAKLNAINAYTGKTIIMGRYEIDRPDVFGTSVTPIEIEDGEVTVRVLPNGQRGFIVRRGTLDVQTTVPIDAGIVLGGRFAARIEGVGVFNGPIDYITTPGGGNAFLSSGTFNGPIRGTTELLLGDVVLNGANDIRGMARVNRGHVIVNHEQALRLPSLQIEDGLMEFNVPVSGSPLMTGYRFDDSDVGTVRLNVDQTIDETWIVNEGIVEANARIAFDRLRVLGIDGLAQVATTDEGRLVVADEIRVIGSGNITGKIAGAGVIRGVGRTVNVNGDLSEFTGDLVVDKGTLSAANSSLGSGTIRIGALGELSLFGDYDIRNDIVIRRSKLGGLDTPAIRHSRNGSEAAFAGRLDIGEGATLQSSNGGVILDGVVAGNNLRLVGGGFSIRAPQQQLGGVLRIEDTWLAIDHGGRLANLDAIEIDYGAQLTIGSADSEPADYVNDATAIKSRGGTVSLYHHLQRVATETLGTLELLQGFTHVSARPSDPLYFNSLDRSPGSILYFSLHSGPGGVGFHSRPDLELGMIGPWAVTENGFATLNDDGLFETLTATARSFATATPVEHVLLAGSETLAKDAIVASLQSQRPDDSIDLGGQQLTVTSGGLFRTANIVNGRLTAGDGTDAELVANFSNRMISADIVDHPAGGSVALVINSGKMTLSGQNSYTGGTWVVGSDYYPSTNAAARIESLSAIPPNDRVYVDNAVYEMQPLREGEVMLDELHIRNGGYVSGSFLAPLHVKRLVLEDGIINALFAGHGDVVKQTEGTVDFSNSRGDEFQGTVTVQAGLLSLDDDSLPNADFVAEGGRLKVTGGRSLSGRVTLAGGTLEGGSFDGLIDVTRESTLFADGFTTLRGTLRGDADLIVHGTLDDSYDRYVGVFGDASEFSGDFRVESGSLRLGAPAGAGTGDIHVRPGARLILGSWRETSPATQIDNTVYVQGGTLISTPPTRGGVAPPASFTGDVYVTDEALIGAIRLGNVAGDSVPGLSFAGRLILGDQATIYGLSDSRNSRFDGAATTLVDVSGELVVAQQTAWHLLTSTVSVSGAIRSSVPEGSINFVGHQDALDLSQAKFQVDASYGLEVQFNGAPFDVQLRGDQAGLAGDGRFAANLELTDGATISPGNSIGEITVVGNTTFGGGATYEWEAASEEGVDGMSWDAVRVEGELSFTATVAHPWVLRVTDLPDVLPTAAGFWQIVSFIDSSGFDPQAVEIDLTEVAGKWPSASPSDFKLSVTNHGLYLQIIPEPASFALAIVGLKLCIGVFRRPTCVR